MDYAKDIKTLRKLMRFGQSLTVFIGGGATMWIVAAYLQAPNDTSIQNIDETRLVYLGIGTVISLVTLLAFLMLSRDAERLLWIWKNTMPQTMTLTIVVDRSTESGPSDFAILRDHQNLKDDWSVPLDGNAWNKADFQAVQEAAIPAKVYFDPKSRKPAVIETKYGLLWRLRDRATKRL